MWRHLREALQWLVGGPPDPKPEPIWRPVVPGIDARPTPPPAKRPRSLDDIDADIHAESVIWAYERRAGRGCPEAVAAWERIELLLDERCRAMALQRVRPAPRRAVSGPGLREIP